MERLFVEHLQLTRRFGRALGAVLRAAYYTQDPGFREGGLRDEDTLVLKRGVRRSYGESVGFPTEQIVGKNAIELIGIAEPKADPEPLGLGARSEKPVLFPTQERVEIFHKTNSFDVGEREETNRSGGGQEFDSGGLLEAGGVDKAGHGFAVKPDNDDPFTSGSRHRSP
jgi:hypothetical protein